MNEQKQDERAANFTSSEIWKLAVDGRKKGEPSANFYTYVDEKRYEKIAGRSLQNEARANSLDWGNLCEQIAHNQLGLEYELISKTRYKHPTLPWSGMPDGIVNGKKITDMKCPFTLKSFLSIYDSIFVTGKIVPEVTTVADLLKQAKREYYWQLISNAILTEINTCELILFMPKRSMLEEIKKASEESGKYYFHLKDDYELPWTSDDKPIDSIIKIEFEVPEADNNHLIERVVLASNLLNK